MIMKMFPNKLPRKIKQYAQILENFSADESAEKHVELGCSGEDLLEISRTVVLFLNDMIWCCTSTTLSLRALKKHTFISGYASSQLIKPEKEFQFPLFQAVSQGYILKANVINFPSFTHCKENNHAASGFLPCKNPQAYKRS